MEFCVVSDLYEAGKKDDGSSYSAEVYYVLAEDDNGIRWKHSVAFRGCEVCHDEETGERYFTDVREAAKAKATHLLARIQTAERDINFDYWIPTYPVYGSPAY